MLYGMNIDFSSKIDGEFYPPSKVDLISVESSFVSSATFETEKDGTFHQIELDQSSIAWGSNLRAGVNVSRAVVAPMTDVTESIVRRNLIKDSI